MKQGVVRSRERKRVWLAWSATILIWAPLIMAQGGKATAPSDVAGVYQAISSKITLSGGLRNSGSPEEIDLLPAAQDLLKNVDVTQDPEKMCQPVGPFRMMAREGTKVEFVPVLSRGMIVMLFEDISRGYFRTIFIGGDRPKQVQPTWQGYSAGRWEGDTLVIETVGLNERTWLNLHGAQHSDALRLVERIRPVLSGRYLEYEVTAEDPKILAKPATYVRYYERLDAEITEDVCEE